MKINLIKKIRLKEVHKPTGFTQHTVDDFFIDDKIVELKIIQYEGDEGYYLFYCDSDGNQLTDTYHESIASALEQAKLEFNIEFHEWEP